MKTAKVSASADTNFRHEQLYPAVPRTPYTQKILIEGLRQRK